MLDNEVRSRDAGGDPPPAPYAEVVHAEREALWRLVDRARHTDDPAVLRDTAKAARRRIRWGDNLTIGNLKPQVGDIVAELDTICDAAFPPPPAGDLTGLLDAPWPTARRKALLAAVLGCDVRHRLQLDEVADRAVGARDTRLLRVLILTPLGTIRRATVARVLEALHQAGELDETVVERAVHDDLYLGHALVGPPRPGCADAVRAHVDALTWQFVTGADPFHWDQLPKVPGPRGLRFVEVALAWEGDPRVAGHLGAAELTPAEQSALVELLRDRPEADRRRAWEWRTRAGDVEALLPLFDLAGAAPLLRLIRAMPDGHEAFRQDRAALLAAIGQAGPETARRLLESEPNELVSAVLGDNRAAVVKRMKNNALRGIAAFGMLPLAPGETVLDRYLALRESAKKGAKLGPNRRHSHAAAIDVALDHLAQVAGAADASRLEWDCEARLATVTLTEAHAGEYRMVLRFDGADPVMTVSRAGRELKSVPQAVRADVAYQSLREGQERLRDQARRMRTGLVERLVATGGTLTPDELAGLRSLPAGAAMLPALLWRDSAGTIGLLDDVDTTGPVTAVHPVDLLESLAGWQAEIMRRRLRQPVKQVFRELYVVTPAERESGDVSHRFDGQTVDGKVAGQLLSGRSWSTHDEYADFQATRPAGEGLVAALRCEFSGYFGMGEVLIRDVRFLRSGRPVPLAEVPPAAFSEVMRDLDLVVSVAGVESSSYCSPSQAAARAQVLSALIANLKLTRVTVDGATAVVRGSRATYRVHLTSGSIHVDPGGYLCVVPARFGATPHRRLFLPFAEEDRMTSIILSKVLLLAQDEKITDASILSQLDTLAPRPAGAG